ncbi:F-box-like protein [Rhizoctonia solani 123E]|uniref:F-box-like protein n=1 Tax=Rhizoctonia solani 123E TaxID=1423351 RepID=A0A074RIA1_9AGAM|nr:F-box-like protein [Rhizoctonia solani 123E]
MSPTILPTMDDVTHRETNAQVIHSNSISLPAVHGKVQNTDLHAEILPLELLSYIFTLGEQAERFVRTKQGSHSMRFQELVSQVCSHWRAVAINNPTLWTWITIQRPSHREIAASYLVRAGSTALLDVEIEMRSGFWDRAEISPTDWAGQLKCTSNLIEFLALDFLHNHAAPALQSLALKWASKSMQHVEEIRAVDGARTSLRSPVLSGPLAPDLRYVELTSVPWRFVLDRPSPLFTGLTSLSLTAATQLNSLAMLANLLRGNPCLQSLHLSSGPDHMDNAYFSDYPLPCISLPELHSFSVRSAYKSDWILDVLQVVQVPNLNKFTLATELYTDYPGEATGPELMLLNFLSGGNGDAWVDGHTSASKSLYPSLRELDISSVGCYSGGKTIMTLLSSFPSVTWLAIANHQIDCLAHFPSVLPKLDCLSLNGDPSPDLGKVLRRRAASGHPIQVVELRGNHYWEPEYRDVYALPVDVTVIEHPEPESFAADDESVIEHWDDEIDDEEQGGYSDAGDEWMEGAEVSLNDDGLEDGYFEENDEEEEYPGDIYLPSCWTEDDGGAYDFDEAEGLYDSGWVHSDSNPFIGEEYQTYEGYEGNEWEGYSVDDSDGDGGEDLEGGGSDYVDNDYGDYGADDY